MAAFQFAAHSFEGRAELPQFIPGERFQSEIQILPGNACRSLPQKRERTSDFQVVKQDIGKDQREYNPEYRQSELQKGEDTCGVLF